MTAPGTVSNKESTFKASRLDLKKNHGDPENALISRKKDRGTLLQKRTCMEFSHFLVFC